MTYTSNHDIKYPQELALHGHNSAKAQRRWEMESVHGSGPDDNEELSSKPKKPPTPHEENIASFKQLREMFTIFQEETAEGLLYAREEIQEVKALRTKDLTDERVFFLYRVILAFVNQRMATIENGFQAFGAIQNEIIPRLQPGDENLFHDLLKEIFLQLASEQASGKHAHPHARVVTGKGTNTQNADNKPPKVDLSGNLTDDPGRPL
ncbi:MAG: hypothetical protein ABH833_01885 [Parcubacteria group bacterium]